MRVSKEQIVRGVTDYARDEILPKMDGSMRIVGTIALNAVNEKVLGKVFENEVVKVLLEDDGSGTYEISGILNSMRDAISQYGSFPVTIPPIPFISPREITLRLNTDDIDAMKRRIEV